MDSFTGIFQGFYLDFKNAVLSPPPSPSMLPLCIDSSHQILKSTPQCSQHLWETLTNIGSYVISMCIVPVQIKLKDTNKTVHTYALLHICSQGTFILDQKVFTNCVHGYDRAHKVHTNGLRTQLRTTYHLPTQTIML